MKTCWQILVLDALEELDRLEAPQGLYGIRQAYSVRGSLPTLAHVLSSSGKTNILRPSGLRGTQSRFGSDELGFSTEGGECVSVQVLDYATTKVRQYGSAYRLDEHHTKRAKTPQWEPENLIPKLSNKSRGNYRRGMLLVIHCASGKELQSLLGRSASPSFLNRYQLTHFSREWEDRNGRVFRTVLHLWTPQGGDADGR